MNHFLHSLKHTGQVPSAKDNFFARAISTLACLILPIALFANAAQPGLWGGRGMGTFSLLYPEDSTWHKKAQMVREMVSIQLYKGFAVVKGEYWMYNTTPDSFQIRAGYPLNASFPSKGNRWAMDVEFDSLYKLKALVDGVEQPLLRTDQLVPTALGNWYVWETKFRPLDTTKIEVYFIVNTNEAVIREGYTVEEINGFIYLLETGATWKPPIGQGTVRIQLMDGLAIPDVRGGIPDSGFTFDANTRILKHEFTNLIPTPEHNIVITYGKQVNDFDFLGIILRSSDYFDAIDRLASIPVAEGNYQPIVLGDPFDAHGTNWFGWTIILLVVVLPLVLLVGIIVAVVLIIRKARTKKAQGD